MTITMISAPAFNYEPVVRNTGLLSKMFLVQVDTGRLHYRFVNVPTSCLRLRPARWSTGCEPPRLESMPG